MARSSFKKIVLFATIIVSASLLFGCWASTYRYDIKNYSFEKDGVETNVIFYRVYWNEEYEAYTSQRLSLDLGKTEDAEYMLEIFQLTEDSLYDLQGGFTFDSLRIYIPGRDEPITPALRNDTTVVYSKESNWSKYNKYRAIEYGPFTIKGKLPGYADIYFKVKFIKDGITVSESKYYRAMLNKESVLEDFLNGQ